MDIPSILKNGIPFPKNIVLHSATTTPEGLMDLCLGYQVADGTQVYAGVITKSANPTIQNGLVNLINGVRQEVGPADDTPLVLTGGEILNLLVGEVMGKSLQGLQKP